MAISSSQEREGHPRGTTTLLVVLAARGSGKYVGAPPRPGSNFYHVGGSGSAEVGLPL